MKEVIEVAKTTAVSPILPVRDVEAALLRFQKMGWKTCAYEGAPYGFVCTGDQEFHVTGSEGVDPLNSTSMLYLYVNDADALFEMWDAAGIGGHFHAPADTEYGLREFCYVDPDGNLFRVGSPL